MCNMYTYLYSNKNKYNYKLACILYKGVLMWRLYCEQRDWVIVIGRHIN